MKRGIVMLPTYDERENIERMIAALFALGVPGLEILVVDDDSPDGTAAIVERLAQGRKDLHLLLRKQNRGRGAAGRDGFLWALERGYDWLLELDADFSHQPRFVPALIQALEGADAAIGSRFVPGGTDDDRTVFRRALTVVANAYARNLLSLPVRDTNSGFRAFSRRALEAINPATLRSQGPAILHESLFRLARAGLSIREVPIEFIDRRQGLSKLDLSKLADGYLWILRLRLFG